LSSVTRVQEITSLDHFPCSVFLLKFIMSWLSEDSCRMRMASSKLCHVTHRMLTLPIQGVDQQTNCNKPLSLPNQKGSMPFQGNPLPCTMYNWNVKAMQHWHLGDDYGLNWTSLRSPGASTGVHFRLSQTLLPYNSINNQLDATITIY
jgi:hypothetical protein